MRATTVGLAIIALMSSSSAWASGLPWTVSESSGPVNVMHSGVSKVVQRGGSLVIGDVVATGANGRAVLVRGKEYLVVSPNSRISIADPAQSGGFIQIVQNWGSTIFKIEKKTEKHFAVKTPYLAAVVKGTTFNVTVDGKGARVQVTEGRVEVATPDGKAVSMVMPGEVGMVSATDTMRLRVQGIESRVIDSPQRGDEASEAKKGVEAEPATEEAKPDKVAEAEVEHVETENSSGRITAAIGEGDVKLESVTSGMISGNSSLVATTKPVQVAVATAVGGLSNAPMPSVSAGLASEDVPEGETDLQDEPEIVAKPPVDADDQQGDGDSDGTSGVSGSPGSISGGSSGTGDNDAGDNDAGDHQDGDNDAGDNDTAGSSTSGTSGSGSHTYKSGSKDVTIASATNVSGGKSVTVSDGHGKSMTFTLPTPKPPTGK